MGKPAYSERLTLHTSSIEIVRKMIFDLFIQKRLKGFQISEKDICDVGANVSRTGFIVRLRANVGNNFAQRNELPDTYQNYNIVYVGAQNQSYGELPPQPRRVDPRTYTEPTVVNPRCR